FVCPYKSPQKLSFISARKCWKCSLIGIIFAIGCRSPFQERLSLVRQSQLTPSRLLHNQRYVTGLAADITNPALYTSEDSRSVSSRALGSCTSLGGRRSFPPTVLARAER